LYSSPLNFFSLSKYTFIRFVTSYSRGLPVSWGRGAKGGGGGGRVPLGRRAPLGGRVPLGGIVAFWGFCSKLKLPFKEYRLVLGFCS